ncbi:MAG: helix-turn-helix domain-containing protein [Lachnospiraceae bacterium]
MSEYHYQISEASRLLAVEAHVLRYWEEELGMIIPRNEMGHRYYTEEHLRIFSQIKDMKERGYQLRAIRAILSGEEPPETPITEIPLRKEHKEQNGQQNPGPDEIPAIGPAIVPGADPARVPSTDPSEAPATGPAELPEPEPGQQVPGAQPEIQMWNPADAVDAEEREKRMNQFQEVMTRIVAQAMLCNNPGLARDISSRVERDLVEEIRGMLNSSESRQEERFRKLDESMRAIQQGNRARYEAAVARSPGLFGRRKRRKKYRRI